MSLRAPLTSKRCILYIYSTNIGTEYFKHALYSPIFSLQNAVSFIMLTCLVPVLFTFYVQDVLKLKKNNSGAKGLIDNLKKKIISRKPKQQDPSEQTIEARKRWITFTYHSRLVRRITNLFKQTQLKIAYKATNTIQQQLTDMQAHNNPSGVYGLKCNTCNKIYVRQSGRTIAKRYKEHIRYIKTNNPTSTYAAHILQNIHEFGTERDTMTLIKACQKSPHSDCWEALYIYTYRKHKILISEQLVNDTNVIFDLASINPQHDTALQSAASNRTNHMNN
jgi:hypothetical protein